MIEDGTIKEVCKLWQNIVYSFIIITPFMYKTKQIKFADFIKPSFVDFQNFQKFNEDRILTETNIWNFDHL